MDAPGTYRGSGAYGTIYRIDPQSGLTTLLMIQLMPNRTDVRDRFLTLVHQSLLEPVALSRN